MIDPRHGSRLYALLRTALVLPLSAALGGCCFVPVQDVVSGSPRSAVYPMPAHVARQRPAAGTALPREVCSAVCGEVDECHAGELASEQPVRSLVIVCRSWDEAHCSSSNFLNIPSGRRRMGRRRAVPAGLVGMAMLEAESVDSFCDLSRALRVHGGPPALLARVRRAASDERRHAELVAALSGHGTPSRQTQRPTPRPPSLYALALHNAREGCVGESWGAFLALVRAERDADPAAAEVMRRIARDEARHAALSWEIDAWLAARLSPTQRTRVLAAKRRAAKAVLRTLHDPMVTYALAFRDVHEARARAAHLFAGLGLC